MKNIDNWYMPDEEKFMSTRIKRADEPKYERKERIYLWKHLEHSDNPRRVAIDIGCNIGIWSNMLSIFFNKVHAFEPNLEVAECFTENILSRKNNVVLHKTALGNENKRGLLSINAGNSGASSLVDTTGKKKLPIEIKMLDDYNFENIDLIKIDVEGYEREVLLGGKNTIKKYKPIIICEKSKSNTRKILESFGAINCYNFRRNEVWSFREEDKTFMIKFGNKKLFKRHYNEIVKKNYP